MSGSPDQRESIFFVCLIDFASALPSHSWIDDIGTQSFNSCSTISVNRYITLLIVSEMNMNISSNFWDPLIKFGAFCISVIHWIRNYVNKKCSKTSSTNFFIYKYCINKLTFPSCSWIIIFRNAHHWWGLFNFWTYWCKCWIFRIRFPKLDNL